MAQRGDGRGPGRRIEVDDQIPTHQPAPGDRFPSRYGGGSPASGGPKGLTTKEILAVVAALIPGVGQIMVGQTVKGLVILGASLVLGCLGGLMSIASVIDAYLVIQAKKRRDVDEWEFFPDFRDAFDI